jgi:hypothetical protein
MFLTIPNYSILDFNMLKFAEHVLDQSPVYATRSLMRQGFKAIESIAAAKDGVAEMADDIGELFQRASAEAPVPRLQLIVKGHEGNPEPIGASKFNPFYEAIEGMSKEAPKQEAQAAE